MPARKSRPTPRHALAVALVAAVLLAGSLRTAGGLGGGAGGQPASAPSIVVRTNDGGANRADGSGILDFVDTANAGTTGGGGAESGTHDVDAGYVPGDVAPDPAHSSQRHLNIQPSDGDAPTHGGGSSGGGYPWPNVRVSGGGVNALPKYEEGPDGFVSNWLQSGLHAPPGEARGGVDRGETAAQVRFHVYDVPRRLIEEPLKLLEERWSTSFCNRGKKRTNYTLLDWRHAHSLFTADVFMSRHLRHHPLHTSDPAKADAFVIPMMTHLFNCAGTLNNAIEILSWVVQERSTYYKRMDHRDHYLFWWRWGMHHGMTTKVWKRIAQHFPNVNFISFDFLELQGRSHFQDFTLSLKPNFLKARDWIVMPYPDFSPALAAPPPIEADTRRDTFFFFAGTSTIGGVRRWIQRSCAVHPEDCTYTGFGANVTDIKRLQIPDYPTSMRGSVFCGHAAGDALSSRRPTSAVLAGCIPVLICDLCLYPFENFIDYSTFAVFVHEEDVINGKLFDILRKIPAERIKAMQANLRKVRSYFEYRTDGPPRPGDALDALARQLVLRGSLYRQYRRWHAFNPHLSSDARDYPAEPCNVKRYVRKGVTTAKELADFNAIGEDLSAAMLKGKRC